MPRERVTTVGSAQLDELRRTIRKLPGILTGRERDIAGIGRGFRSRIAWQWVSLVRNNFQRLGRGQAGADGTIWPPLSRSYLAYGRPKRGRGRPKAGKKWPGGKDGFMTEAQVEQWWADYRQALAWQIKRLSLAEAKPIAAAIATNKYNARGGRTKLHDPGFGGRQVGRDYQTLVDRGILRNSLTPGELVRPESPDSTYSAPEGQIFREVPGQVVVGTDVPYAAAHHFGRRRLWPADLPAEWRNQIVEAANAGLSRIQEVLAR